LAALFVCEFMAGRKNRKIEHGGPLLSPAGARRGPRNQKPRGVMLSQVRGVQNAVTFYQCMLQQKNNAVCMFIGPWNLQENWCKLFLACGNSFSTILVLKTRYCVLPSRHMESKILDCITGLHFLRRNFCAIQKVRPKSYKGFTEPVIKRLLTRSAAVRCRSCSCALYRRTPTSKGCEWVCVHARTHTDYSGT